MKLSDLHDHQTLLHVIFFVCSHIKFRAFNTPPLTITDMRQRMFLKFKELAKANFNRFANRAMEKCSHLCIENG